LKTPLNPVTPVAPEIVILSSTANGMSEDKIIFV
jgi:hypothetical protein